MSIKIPRQKQWDRQTGRDISATPRIFNLPNFGNDRTHSRNINENKNNKTRLHDASTNPYFVAENGVKQQQKEVEDRPF